MTWLWVGLAVLVVVAGALVPLFAGRGHRVRSNDEAVAARSRHARLAHYVEDPVATEDEEAAALLRRARERWNTAGSVLATAVTEEDFRLAERIADEGMTHVAAAYARLGLDGPGGS